MPPLVNSLTTSRTILVSSSLFCSSTLFGGGAVAARIDDIAFEFPELAIESKDGLSSACPSVLRTSSIECIVSGVRFDNLGQNDSLSAMVLASGEVVRESSEPGVEAPEPVGGSASSGFG